MPLKRLLIVLSVAVAGLIGSSMAFSMLYSSNASDALDRGHYKQAAKYLRKAADEGDISALTMLGNLHHLGLGVDQNMNRSVALYSEAAFAGSPFARVNLGHAYSRGYGVEEDAGLAYAWYNLARNSGSTVAQFYMSEMLAEHRLRYNKVVELSVSYATINNFEKLH